MSQLSVVGLLSISDWLERLGSGPRQYPLVEAGPSAQHLEFSLAVRRGPSVERGKEQTLLLSDFAPGELVDIWLRPNATHLATVAVGDDGTLQLPFIAEVGAGEAGVTVTRAFTRGQMAVEFTVTHQTNRSNDQNLWMALGGVT